MGPAPGAASEDLGWSSGSVGRGRALAPGAEQGLDPPPRGCRRGWGCGCGSPRLQGAPRKRGVASRLCLALRACVLTKAGNV